MNLWTRVWTKDGRPRCGPHAALFRLDPVQNRETEPAFFQLIAEDFALSSQDRFSKLLIFVSDAGCA